MATIYIPTFFRQVTEGNEYILVEGSNILESLESLSYLYPEMHDLIFDSNEQILRHVNVYINNHEIHELEGLDTLVNTEDQIAVIPALAGGAMTLSEENNRNQSALKPEEVMRYSRHIIMPLSLIHI